MYLYTVDAHAYQVQPRVSLVKLYLHNLWSFFVTR
jgi:hypothetical protein